MIYKLKNKLSRVTKINKILIKEMKRQQEPMMTKVWGIVIGQRMKFEDLNSPFRSMEGNGPKLPSMLPLEAQYCVQHTIITSKNDQTTDFQKLSRKNLPKSLS